MLQLTKAETGALRQQIIVNEHSLFTDVARQLGGDNSAPDPHDLYDASLAGCKALTLFLYARRKQIPLDHIVLNIDRDNSKEAAGLYQLHVQLQLVGALSAEQKQQLLEIAGKCPIHKLMSSSETRITTELVD